MRKFGVGITGLLAAIAIANAVVADVTLEEVEKDIITKFEKVKYLSATSRTQSRREAKDMIMTSKGTGTVEYAFEDGKQMIYMTDSREMETQFVKETIVGGSGKGSNSLRGSIAAEFLNDGEAVYTIMGQPGRQSVMKDSPDRDGIPRFGRSFFETLPKHQDPRLLPNEKHEGEEVYVIEGVIKSRPKDSPVASMRYYYRVSDGIWVKQTNHEEDGKLLATTVYENFKINVPIPRERFKLNVPPGTTITDSSQQNMAGPSLQPGGAAGGAQQRKPAPTTQPASRPARAPASQPERKP